MAATMLGFGGLWAVPWLNSIHGYSTREAAGITSMLFLGWAIFSPVVGWASDRIGRRNPLLTLGSLTALVAFALIIFLTPDSTALLVTLFFLTGVGGCAMTVAFSSVKEHNSLDFSSTALGLMNMCIVGSGAVMQPLIGWLLDLNWSGKIIDGARVYSAGSYTIALSSLLVVATIAFAATLLLRETRCSQVG
jgi:MFS family permease